ncbi:hypothetical protein NUH88_13035 [Nisaea acidiphila]|uniref:Uncharacterized protein n=1 Tax=Nisaea acidiphila TaxID=1862145 RepID=A0A9J7AN08_9PROT|nr:hypothetical protein [Nisaea acidiphila]UUX48338.1 hypothetical protein NUH88_13035 [Nisaea acidiphila]
MPKYTPGPWRMNQSGEIWSYARGAAPSQIGTVSWTGEATERQGNAQIIAASADLSECLDEVLLLVSQPEIADAILGSERLVTRARMILDNARTVLKEATGREIPEWPLRDPSDARLDG